LIFTPGDERIEFSNSDFPTVDGFPHVTQQAVMPVIAYRGRSRVEEIRPLGTGFSISPHGLMLTARHVVDEALDLGHWSTGQPFAYDEEWWLGALYVRRPLPGEDVEMFGGLLPAHKVHVHGDLDMAVISLNLPLHVPSGERLRMRHLRLGIGLPKVGLPCYGLGYHSMKSTMKSTLFTLNTKTVVDYFQHYSATRGTVEELHFPRRDNWLLPFPCFRTSARFDPGMSGGPIMDSAGSVIGMICSSQNTQEEDYISYASLIGPALLIQVEATLPSGEVKEVFLYDFVVGGSVLLDGTAQDVTFVREGAQLTMNFAKP
jgi:hypothetical protein